LTAFDQINTSRLSASRIKWGAPEHRSDLARAGMPSQQSGVHSEILDSSYVLSPDRKVPEFEAWCSPPAPDLAGM